MIGNKEVSKLLQEIWDKGLLIQAIFSSPRSKESASKITLRPIDLKGERYYQASEQRDTKVFHRNLSAQDCLLFISQQLLPSFKQAILNTTDGDFHLLTNKKGATTVLKKEATQIFKTTSHNRPKNYLLEPDASFLLALGVTNSQGRVLPQKMDKFRQINRFLELVNDTLHAFNKERKLHVVDFGCGKAYLTFALYHFLHDIKDFDVEMVGLDLKEDVIALCRDLAKNLQLEGLTFQVGDIATYQTERVDLMIALHACDTATDAALERAVRWGAEVILAAPCCQHELFKQVRSEPLEALLQYGILKERFASLVTDAARAQLLEMQGYTTQVLEFIESEHTPKNLAIRAIKGNSAKRRSAAEKQYIDLKKALSITPTLEKGLMS